MAGCTTDKDEKQRTKSCKKANSLHNGCGKTKGREGNVCLVQQLRDETHG